MQCALTASHSRAYRILRQRAPCCCCKPTHGVPEGAAELGFRVWCAIPLLLAIYHASPLQCCSRRREAHPVTSGEHPSSRLATGQRRPARFQSLTNLPNRRRQRERDTSLRHSQARVATNTVGYSAAPPVPARHCRAWKTWPWNRSTASQPACAAVADILLAVRDYQRSASSLTPSEGALLSNPRAQ